MRFLLDLVHKVRPHSTRSIGGLAFQPFTSMFLYESGAYASRHDPEVGRKLEPYRDMLDRARLRTKLLDDTRPFDERLSEDVDLAAISSGWVLDSRFRLIRRWQES
jgi:hypothetical protein